MVQLTQDSFAFGKKLIKLDKAINLIKKNIQCNKKVNIINTTKALDKILATDVISKINVPPYSNSAVDGYAIGYKEYLNGVREFKIAGKSSAGHPFNKLIKKQSAIRVLTGAMLPKGLDTIIMEEDCLLKNNILRLPNGIKKNNNYRSLGEDIKINSKIFNKGHKIRPQDIGVLSSIGINKISAYKPLKVAIFSCGDELIKAGKTLRKGHLYDSNREMLINFIKKLGFIVEDLGILKDNINSINDKINNASKNNDLIITSGGMSLGEEDHIKKLIEKNGKMYAWRLAIKPGRPVGFGQYKNCSILGLPGNPAAAFVTFLLIGIPILKTMSGELIHKYNLIPITSDFTHKKKKGRKEFIRVNLINKDNKLLLKKFPREGAGILSSTAWASGLAIMDENIENIKSGDKIKYLSFNELLN